MATITQARYTPEDLLLIDDRAMPELVDGQLLEREVGQKSDSIAATLLIILGSFVRANNLGLVNGAQCGYQIFPFEADRVRISTSLSRAKIESPRPGRPKGMDGSPPTWWSR